MGADRLNSSRAVRIAYVTCKEWNRKRLDRKDFEQQRLVLSDEKFCQGRFNAGGTADIITIISVPGYLCITGLFALALSRASARTKSMKNLFFNAFIRADIGREPATEMEQSGIEVRCTAERVEKGASPRPR